MSIGDGGELIVCCLAGGVEGEAVVGAARHGVAQVLAGKPASEDRDLGQVAQQPTTRIHRRVPAQGILSHTHVRGDRSEPLSWVRPGMGGASPLKVPAG